MFTNNRRQEERTGKYGTPRLQYLQELVSQFQNATDEETKERIIANLVNFAYECILTPDCITEPSEKLVEFGVGGVCNSCADPTNAAIVSQSGGIPLIIQCLSSPVRNTEEVLKPKVIDVIKRYAAAETVSVSSSNLAKAFLDKHVSDNEWDKGYPSPF